MTAIVQLVSVILGACVAAGTQLLIERRRERAEATRRAIQESRESRTACRLIQRRHTERRELANVPLSARRHATRHGVGSGSLALRLGGGAGLTTENKRAFLRVDYGAKIARKNASIPKLFRATTFLNDFLCAKIN
jgi:hypothetical protein